MAPGFCPQEFIDQHRKRMQAGFRTGICFEIVSGNIILKHSNQFMDIREFNIMDGIAKTEVLATAGVFLAERTDGCYRIILYQVNNFYVEIYYHLTRYCYICIRSFENVGELYPYLPDVDISEIYKLIYGA